MTKTHRFRQGDDGQFKLPLYFDNQSQPIDGWQLWFTVKRLPSDPDSAAVFQKSTAAGSITTYDLTTALVTVDAADTQAVAPGRYYFDVQGRRPGGGIETLETGVFILDPQITAAP